MQSQQQILKISGSAAAAGAFPSPVAYNLIFLTATVLSVSSIGFAIIIGRNSTKNNKTVLTPKIQVSDT
jgi:hypothetical protein